MSVVGIFCWTQRLWFCPVWPKESPVSDATHTGSYMGFTDSNSAHNLCATNQCPLIHLHSPTAYSFIYSLICHCVLGQSNKLHMHHN